MNDIEIYLQSMQHICPSIKDEHLIRFRETLSVQHFSKNEEVFRLNQQHNSIVFITKGLVRSYYINEKGEEKNSWFIKEYEFATDYPCFLTGRPSNYTFQCLEETTGVILPKKAIYQGYDDFASLDKYGRLIAEEVVKMMQARIEDLLFLPAKERYQKILENESDLVKRISVSHLSSYVGIERQSLTRIRKELSNQK
jgi:CRP-like cAMP-binding protein